MSDLVKRLRARGNALNGPWSPDPACVLCNDAANRIEELERRQTEAMCWLEFWDWEPEYAAAFRIVYADRLTEAEAEVLRSMEDKKPNDVWLLTLQLRELKARN